MVNRWRDFSLHLLTAIEYDTDVNNTAYSRVKHYINNGKAYSYEYDVAGNISKITDPNGSYVEYEYDSLNQLSAEHYSTCLPLSGEVASAQAEDGGVVSYDTIEYSYDTRGNPSSTALRRSFFPSRGRLIHGRHLHLYS